MKKKQNAPRLFDSFWTGILAALIPIAAVIGGVLGVHLRRPLDPVQLKISIASSRSPASKIGRRARFERRRSLIGIIKL